MNGLAQTSFIVAIITLIFLADIQAGTISPNRSVPNEKTIETSDAIVEGSFALDKVLLGTDDSIFNDAGQKIDGKTFSVPFQVDQSIKGNASNLIYVKIFCPTDIAASAKWLFPLKEKMLLFLKQDAPKAEYYLSNPWNDWLPAIEGGKTNVQPSSSNQIAKDQNVKSHRRAKQAFTRRPLLY